MAVILMAACWTNAAAVEGFDSPSRCQEIRLDQAGGPLANLPVYNQSLGITADPDICYAVTASELIDAYRVQHQGAIHTLASPLSIALRARLHDLRFPLEGRSSSYDDSNPITFMIGGGSVVRAMNASRQQMVCDQQWLEPSIKLFKDSASAQAVDRYLLESKSPKFIAPYNSKIIESALEHLGHHCGAHQFSLEFAAPTELNRPNGDYLGEQLSLAKEIQSGFLSTEAQTQKIKAFQEKFDPEKRIKLFGEAIERLLSANTPIGIGYMYRSLKEVDHLGSLGGHASVIVGRRWGPETHQCELLVRDSYGPSCVAANGKPRYELPCENGSVWVNARTLLQDTLSLAWIP